MKYQDEFLAPFLSEAVEASVFYFFLKLVDETEISNPPEATRHHNSKKKNTNPSTPQSHLESCVSK